MGISHRVRSVTLSTSLCLAPLAFWAATQSPSSSEKIRLYVEADSERGSPAGAVKRVDVEESANELRKRVKGLDGIRLVERRDAADMVVTITGRRQDASKGYVLNYVLQAGDYIVEDEFSYAGGVELSGGARAIGSDGRTAYDGRKTVSWDELVKQFAKSLEGFAKANHKLILKSGDLVIW